MWHNPWNNAVSKGCPGDNAPLHWGTPSFLSTNVLCLLLLLLPLQNVILFCLFFCVHHRKVSSLGVRMMFYSGIYHQPLHKWLLVVYYLVLFHSCFFGWWFIFSMDLHLEWKRIFVKLGSLEVRDMDSLRGERKLF